MAAELLTSWDEGSPLGVRTRLVADLAAEAMGERRSALLEVVSLMLGREDDVQLAEAYMKREPYWRSL